MTQIDPQAVELFLSTKQVRPAPCDKNLFKEGVEVLRLAGPRMWAIESYVTEASRRAGVPIDWHFCGGIAIVLAFEKDAGKAIEILGQLMPSLEEATRQAKERGDGGYDVRVFGWSLTRPPRPDQLPKGAIGMDVNMGVVFVSQDEG